MPFDVLLGDPFAGVGTVLDQVAAQIFATSRARFALLNHVRVIDPTGEVKGKVGSTYTVEYYDPLAYSATKLVADGAVNYNPIAVDKVDVVIKEHPGVGVRLNSLADLLGATDKFEAFYESGVLPVVKAMHDDIVALHSSPLVTKTYTATGVPPAAGENRFISAYDMFRIRELLFKDNSFTEGKAILSLETITDMATDTQFVGYRTDQEKSEMGRTGNLGTFAGFPIIEDQLLAKVSDTINSVPVTRHKNFFLGTQGICMVPITLTHSSRIEQNSTMVIKQYRDPETKMQLRIIWSTESNPPAELIRVDALYGIGILNPNDVVVVDSIREV